MDGGDHVKIELNVTTPVSGATLMKTNQSVSYRTGDDGDIEAGRAVSFTVLSINNPFGNSNRFTDILGGQTYSDNIVIDWSTFNGSKVLGWRRTKSTGYTDWNTAIDAALALSIGGFGTGWRLPNRGELFSILNHGVATSVLNYAPFSITADTNLWTSTTNHIVTANAFVLASTGNGSMSAFNKGLVAAEYIPCRTFTVTGTTLS
jgi:hypothetical protein